MHLILAKIDTGFDQYMQNGDVTQAAHSVQEYIRLCKLPPAKDGWEELRAYLVLRASNRLRAVLPFMQHPATTNDKLPYEYPDRAQAWWIHKLATRYGWSRDDLLRLWPEEAACYLQEILVAEFSEADQQRSLSKLAYDYNRSTGEYRYRPVVRPGWMMSDEAEKKRPIRRSMLPMGVVVDVSGYGIPWTNEETN